MRVADLLKQKAGKPVISFEFSRPKSEKATANLDKALDRLVECELATEGEWFLSSIVACKGSPL